ncbi:hypothetical protein [Bradyrhizobium uaiense]|uniref:Uncharacterized protein n=1 Tax=Bradyrhizobium uaiense TaxID=2594946 RepID=A0A6P1B8T8_9BRAD|nr:hypothetical protein [Bradyrhizobium uaiense]NEU94783.1 hypothetical protein [Bradyrhizobium uaiense]
MFVRPRGNQIWHAHISAIRNHLEIAVRPDLANCALRKLNLIGLRRIEYPNGAISEAADYAGYRAEDKAGNVRVFLQLLPGDPSVDWLEITDKTDQFIVVVSGIDRTGENPA